MSLPENRFARQLQSPKSDRFIFWVIYTLFLINDRLFKVKRLERWCWSILKCELFYIGGACAHSGNCCRHLMIYEKGKPINTEPAFKAKCKETPSYSRFIPQLNDDSSINSFLCRCLKQNNTCNDYENRPLICHRYPFSHFILFDQILDGCGYKVCKKDFQPKIRNQRLLHYIEKVK